MHQVDRRGVAGDALERRKRRRELVEDRREPVDGQHHGVDRKATAISLLVVIGVRADGQKVLLVSAQRTERHIAANIAKLPELLNRPPQE